MTQPDPQKTKYWPTPKADELLHPCERCGGGGWIAVPDPLDRDGALIDARCPDCSSRENQ